jgi:hypothetical protein
MYLRRLRLENVGTFRNAELTLNVPGTSPQGRALPNVTLLVGAAGAGKTTALRAIAIAALVASTPGAVVVRARELIRRQDGPPARSRMRADMSSDDDRTDERAPSLTIDLRPGDRDELLARTLGRRAGASLVQSPFVVAYGAHRVVRPFTRQAQRAETTAVARIATLFDDKASLVHPQCWLPRLPANDLRRHAEAVALLRTLGVARAELLGDLVDGGLRFRVGGADHPFDALSAGQRAHLGWLGDLLFHAIAHLPARAALAEVRGLVLVDQIDLHLHPDAQREIVPTIARAFPGLQFVITTHSPLVVGSVWKSNVRRVEASSEGASIVASSREVFGLSADQLLAGDQFAVASTRNAAFDRHLQRETRAARGGDPEAALRVLRLLTLGGAAIDDATPAARSR